MSARLPLTQIEQLAFERRAIQRIAERIATWTRRLAGVARQHKEIRIGAFALIRRDEAEIARSGAAAVDARAHEAEVVVRIREQPRPLGPFRELKGGRSQGPKEGGADVEELDTERLVATWFK